MSATCLIHIRQPLKYERMAELSKKIILQAMKYDIGVHFNCFDFDKDLVKSGNMINFFHLSDDFLCKNCSLLDTSCFVSFNDFQKIRKSFSKKYIFLKSIMFALADFKIEEAELYLSNDGSVDDVKDFKVLYSDKRNLLDDILRELIESKDEYAYGFPTVKIIVRLL